jgi:hypothetical protein
MPPLGVGASAVDADGVSSESAGLQHRSFGNDLDWDENVLEDALVG